MTLNNNLLSITIGVLQEYGIEVEYNSDFRYSIRKALEKAGKYLFIIVDEIDQLYQTSPDDDPWYHITLESLSQLAGIGDDSSGRFSAVVCGSSSRVALLINANGRKDDMVIKEFPLVKISPNLNGNKFRTRRIFTNPPTDLEVAAHIWSDDLVYSNNIELMRAITFITGGVPREIQRLKLGRKEKTKFTSFHIESNQQALSTLSSPAGALWKDILKLLKEKNKTLISELTDSLGHVDMEKVRTTPWEIRLQPLTLEEIQACWKGNPELLNLEQWLYHLFDRDYITIRKRYCRMA